LQVRPHFRQPLLKKYLKTQALTESGNIDHTINNRRSWAHEIKGTEPRWLPAWLLHQTAEALVPSRKWKEAADLYSEALSQQDNSDHAIRMILFRGLGFNLWYADDEEGAEKNFLLAVSESKNLDREDLFAAKCFYLLGLLTSSDPA
jgi:hypothetical protein